MSCHRSPRPFLPVNNFFPVSDSDSPDRGVDDDYIVGFPPAQTTGGTNDPGITPGWSSWWSQARNDAGQNERILEPRVGWDLTRGVILRADQDLRVSDLTRRLCVSRM